MTRKPHLWLFVCLLLFGFTEYEQEVGTLPPGAIGGGCPGEGLPTEPQATERDRYYSMFGWPIITDEAANKIAQFVGARGAVDFGAGAGYLAHLLTRRGVDVAAIDDFSWGVPEKFWHPVVDGGMASLQGTHGATLVLSWPPHETGMATSALTTWGGDQLVYVGEILRGSAEPPFFAELAANWRLVEEVRIPQWYNRSDSVWLFERNTGNGMGFDTMRSLAFRGCS